MRGVSGCKVRIGLFAVLGVSVGCEEAEQFRDRFRDMTPHEAYQASLVGAGLGETALARDWVRAGREALGNSVRVALPFREESLVAPEVPSAVAYRFALGRGRKLEVDVSMTSPEDVRLFVDLFRVPDNEDDPWRPVSSSDSMSGTFTYESRRDGDFVLRLQPELLRGGNYRVTLGDDAQLGFPVEGHGMGAIGSRFGAPRDGGRRLHRGVDIFARRGTPVLAASAGRTQRVSVRELGGKVVWIHDSIRNARVYYAHLDSQHVRSGQEVARGDTIGFVGNTGNARTTPPHLHFGIYLGGEGAVDPTPFLEPSRGRLPALVADPAILGSRVQPRDDGVPLRAAPGQQSRVIRSLDQDAAPRVMGVTGAWFRVRLPGGGHGYLAVQRTQPVEAGASLPAGLD